MLDRTSIGTVLVLTGPINCRLINKLDFEEAKFSLYFLAYENHDDIPDDAAKRVRCLQHGHFHVHEPWQRISSQAACDHTSRS